MSYFYRTQLPINFFNSKIKKPIGTCVGLCQETSIYITPRFIGKIKKNALDITIIGDERKPKLDFGLFMYQNYKHVENDERKINYLN